MAASSSQCYCTQCLKHLQSFCKNYIAVLEQPPYSPDPVSGDFFLFLKVEGIIKITCFQDSTTITIAVIKELQAIPEESFHEYT